MVIRLAYQLSLLSANDDKQYRPTYLTRLLASHTTYNYNTSPTLVCVSNLKIKTNNLYYSLRFVRFPTRLTPLDLDPCFGNLFRCHRRCSFCRRRCSYTSRFHHSDPPFTASLSLEWGSNWSFRLMHSTTTHSLSASSNLVGPEKNLLGKQFSPSLVVGVK